MIKIEKWVEEKQKGQKLSLLKSFLWVCSVFYKGVIGFRHLLYKCGIFSIKQAEIPVISIGNVVCGGTGKSEFVAKLISDLKRDDLAIATRGYRSKRKGSSRLVKDKEDGDEPFMLQQRLPNTSVIVGKRRELSAKLATKMGKKAVILDDGMQYLRLKKDIQVILMRADDLFGGGFVPYGMRREWLFKLQSVDFIIIHGVTSSAKYELAKREVMCYSRAKCFGTQYSLDNSNNKLQGKKVGVFCGIGNPQAFMRQIENLGLNVVKKKILADHQKLFGVEAFYDACKKLGAEKVLCTAKDYVKLDEKEKQFVFPVKISMNIVFDTHCYEELLTIIDNNISVGTEKKG